MIEPVAPALRPVHARLVLAMRREEWVGDAVAAALGHDALSVLAAARRAHPVHVPEDADELSTLSDPYGVVERAVAALLTREAAGHRALLLLFGDDAEVRLRLAAFDHGVETGREIAAGRGPLGPARVFDALDAHVLEDMPCRPQASLLHEDSRRVAWAHERCPYRAAWQDAGAPMRPACQIMSAWIRGLATGLDAAVEYRRPKSVAMGDERCEHELVAISR
jgi:hypothetical protein